MIAFADGGGDGGFIKYFGAAQGVPGAVDNAGFHAAEINFFADGDGFDVKLRAPGFKDAKRHRHDFRTDAVAMGDGDGGFL